MRIAAVLTNLSIAHPGEETGLPFRLSIDYSCCMSDRLRMKIRFVSYIDQYYREIQKTKTPQRQSGKFVQIRHHDTEYLVFSPKELTSYHADIVERFCRENRLPGSYAGGEKRFEIAEPGWVVVGGGKFDLDREAKTIRLYDNSMAYGKFDSKGLAETVMRVEDLSGYSAQVE